MRSVFGSLDRVWVLVVMVVVEDKILGTRNIVQIMVARRENTDNKVTSTGGLFWEEKPNSMHYFG